MKKNDPFPVLAIINPNKAWVSAELDKLMEEWEAWNDYSQNIEDSPDYNPQTGSEAIKDGWSNIRKHEILREKTLVFMRNHFSGAEFVLINWSSHPHESNTSRLKDIIPGWLHRLEILKESMDYVRVPDGFWKARGKELLETLSKSSGENAIEVVTSYLKNPMGK